MAGGTDTLSYGTTTTTAAVTVNLTTNVASGFATIAGVENVTGGAGADTLTGRIGINNTLSGAAGNDTFFVHDTTDVVSGGANVDLVNSIANTYTITNVDVENLTFTGTGNFTGTATHRRTSSPAVRAMIPSMLWAARTRSMASPAMTSSTTTSPMPALTLSTVVPIATP